MDKVEDLKEMCQLWSENKDEEAYGKWEQGELEKIVLQHQQQHQGRGESGAAGEGIDVVVSRPRHDPEGVFNTFAAGITALTRETMEEGSALTSRAPSHTGSYSRLSRPCVGAPGHGRGPKKNEPVPIGCRIFGNGSRIPGVPEKGQ